MVLPAMNLTIRPPKPFSKGNMGRLEPSFECEL